MTCSSCRGIDRRALLGLLGLGVASVLAGCSFKPGVKPNRAVGAAAAAAGNHVHRSPHPSPTPAAAPPMTVPPVPTPAPGRSQIFWHGPPAAAAARQVAITIDDGYCAECAQAYAELAQRTGIHITFNPNGCYGEIWSPLAKTLKPLIEAGQVQIGNHTFNHKQLTELTDTQITAELEQNEHWIEQAYGITARPWWRPPYGFHNEHVPAPVTRWFRPRGGGPARW